MNYNGLCHMKLMISSTVKDKTGIRYGRCKRINSKKTLAKALSGKVAQFTAFAPPQRNPKMS
jgi:hypothetical protein